MSAKKKKDAKGGRPKGSKDSKPRGRKKNLPTVPNKTEVTKDLSEKDLSIYNAIEGYLSAENKKLFKQLMPEQKTPLQSLKSLRDFLVARFKFYTIVEVEGKKEAKRMAKLQLKELKEHGTVNGRRINANYVERKKLQLQEIINSKGRMNTSLNTLAKEIREYNELIDRIESGNTETTINIFQILKGNADEQTTDKLTKELFKRTDDVDDVMDAEFTTEEDDG